MIKDDTDPWPSYKQMEASVTTLLVQRLGDRAQIISTGWREIYVYLTCAHNRINALNLIEKQQEITTLNLLERDDS